VAAIVVGCFLPWATITAPSFDPVARSGMAGDGIVFLCLALAAGALAFDLRGSGATAGASLRWGLGALIAALALLSTFEMLDLAGRLGDPGETEAVRSSYGLWLVGLGVLAAIVGWARMPWAQMVEPRAGDSA